MIKTDPENVSALNKILGFIKFIALFAISCVMSGIIGNAAYSFLINHWSANNIFLSFLSQKIEVNYLQMMLVILCSFSSALIVRFRYVKAWKKSEELFNIQQNYLDLINDICSGKNEQSFMGIVQNYIEDIVSFHPEILGAAAFLPDSENPQVLVYACKHGVTVRNLSGDKYYPESDNPQERGAVGEAFHEKENVIVSINKKEENGRVKYEAEPDVYRFPERDNSRYPGYKSMIAVPILTYNSENKKDSMCH
jgi:hypothetical protein